MTKKSEKEKDVEKKYAFDVDRMVSEGLAGGEVDQRYNDPQVDKSRPLKKEEEPTHSKDH